MPRNKFWMGFMLVLVAVMFTSFALEAEIGGLKPFNTGIKMKKRNDDLRRPAPAPVPVPPLSCTIEDFAGKGRVLPSFSGDGGRAIDAHLNGPNGLTFDGHNLYIADVYNHKIRQVATDGVIRTVVDGLQFPNAIVFNSGRLFIADAGSNVVLMMNPRGVISRFAEVESPLGLAFDSSRNLYVSSGDRIKVVRPNGTVEDFLQIPSATLTGLTFDRNRNLYAADVGNHKIYKIETNKVITPVVGTGAYGSSGDGGPALLAQIAEPWGIVFDGNGNLFIADADNSKIRIVNTGGLITYLDLTPPLSGPYGLVFDNSGRLYVSDGEGDKIRRVNCTSTSPSVVY